MNYYVSINHPYRIGETIYVVPTGKTSTEERKGESILEGIVITPKAGIEKVWFGKSDLCITQAQREFIL